jgi:hypothetical protein
MFSGNGNPVELLPPGRQVNSDFRPGPPALFKPKADVLLLSPGQRQSQEIFRKVLDAYNAIGRPVRCTYETQLRMELENGSRILCLPGKEATIRGYTPILIIIDEASRVPDDLYRAVRPMLAVSHGQIVAISTPFGQRGWFFNEWESDRHWKRVKIKSLASTLGRRRTRMDRTGTW